ncbi:ABC transporter permease [Conexibacter sp. S30A1]|uniref:ABC transporter permease n=1 Tax=Conexibacter sp. S30A1 TaxID=2937800 RepID=UPI00200F8640|nr:ABC transporter permease [Conexibacter sp. S30A1]
MLQIISVAALFLAAAVTISGFVNKDSIYTTLLLASFLGLAAAGETLVILIGAIDLSVPAMISGANLMSTDLAGKGWPFGLVIVLVLFGAAVVGVVNGLVTHRFRAPPLIVTLATGAVVTGATLGWTRGGQVSGSPPAWLTQFSSPIGKTFGIGIPPLIVLWVAVAVAIGIVLHHSVSGRRLYATGANEAAAVLAGVNTGRIWMGAYTVSAVGSAVVGLVLVGFTGQGEAGVGDPYLFLALAAVLVGGTSLVGARGDYWRTLLGALIMTLITTLLVGHGAGEALQEILTGLLILMFVGLYGREQRVRDRV